MSEEPNLVPQPHGGAILDGGVLGNKGGSGRPPSSLRRRLRSSLAQRVEVAEAIADDEGQRASDRLRAIDLLAKYGLGPNDPNRISTDEFAGLMEQLGRVVFDEVKDPDVRGRIEARWQRLAENRA